MIEDLHAALVAELKATPGMQDVCDYGHATKLKTPAAIVNLAEMRADYSGLDATGRLPLVCRWEIFLVLGNTAINQALKLRTLAAHVAHMIDGKSLVCGAPEAAFVSAEPNEFEPSFEHAKSWRVEFEQMLYLGEYMWSDEGAPPEKVFASYAPLIGAAHEDKYFEVKDELPDLGA
ncbi:hypothetical protein [Desulfobaculum bizertense]|uniref:Uncharacterized protein n=1 Tax=Desulfobaculum bizertense DSM 18034 TaxID=1121442 RepID=A0A1T4WXJ9_9BACT|nr:hypothetical protein [Desulfobaculum bizertense]SKA81939.1 hypothetical protein SAMN02745702_02775 [Desulfobaculum bizertense DSM 18034]